MGRTRYTNPWVPKGHIHVSSPRDSTWVADSGWVSKTSNLRLLQFSYFFNLWLLQTLISSIIQFLQSSTSYIFDFKCNGQNRWVLESALPMGVNFEFIFWCLPPTMDSMIFFLVLHSLSSRSNSSSGARPALPMGVAPEAMVGYL
jgi:hypothetical protein